MATPDAPPSRRWRRWLLGAVLLVGVLVACTLMLPRWLVQTTLARALGATVTLERLELVSSGEVTLHGLNIEQPTELPPVVSVRVASLRVEGTLRQLREGHVDRLTVTGAEVDLEPAPWPTSSDPSPLRYDVLDLQATPVSIRSDRGTTRIEINGRLSDDGAGPRGSLEVRAPRLDLAPVFDLVTFGRPEGAPAPSGLAEAVKMELQLIDTPQGRVAVESLDLHQGTDRLMLGPTQVELAPELVTAAVETLEARVGGFEVQGPDISFEARFDPVAGLGQPTQVLAQAQRLQVLRQATDSDTPQPPPTEPSEDAASSDTAGSVAAPDPIVLVEPRLTLLPEASALGPTSPRLVGRFACQTLTLPGTPEGPQQQLDQAEIELTLDPLAPAGSQRWRVEAHPRLPGIEQSQLLMEVGVETGPETLAVEWRGLELERWLPWFEPRLSELSGRSEGALVVGPASLALEVMIPEARGSVNAGTQTLHLIPELFPVRLEIDSGRPGLTPSLAGSARLGTPLGRLELGGQIGIAPLEDPDQEASPRLDATWRWHNARVETLLPVVQRSLRNETLPRTSDLPLSDQLTLSKQLALAGQLTLSGTVQGTLAAPELAGTLQITELAATPADSSPVEAQLSAGELAAKFHWTSDSPPRVADFELRGDLAFPGLQSQPLALDIGALRGGVDSTTVAIDALRLTLPAVKVGASLQGDLEAGLSGLTGTVEIEALDVANAVAALETPPVPGFSFQGTGRTMLQLRPEGDRLSVQGPWSLEGLGFLSDDGGRVLEGLGAKGQLTAQVEPEGRWRGEVSGDTTGFLLLWNTLFADLSGAQPTLQLTADGPDPTSLGKARLGLSLDATTTVEATLAQASTEGWPWTLRVMAPDLSSLHQDLLLPALGAEKVGEQLAGRVEGKFAGTVLSAEAWSIEGRLQVEGLDWWSGQRRVRGLEAELPLGLIQRDGTLEGARQTGRLAFDSLAQGPLVLPSVTTPLWVEGDAFGLESALTVPLYGGTVAIERLTLTDLLGVEPALVAGVSVQGVQLADIAEAYELLPLEGVLEGQLPRLRLAGSELVVEGGGTLELFDGVVRIHGITGRDILSPFPRLTLSADLENLDLGQFTRKIDFGEMTGVLEGSITNCELFRGVPVTCRAHLETVERPGVRRTVDVKAVNNLTILGTGQGNLFDRGIRRFFKRFTYDRLLLDLELADDVLLMRGQPVRGGREAFLSGRLPFPIEVVNAQPGRTVSFLTMRRRLESLDFDRATTSP